MIEAALYAHLSGFAAVAALAAGGVHPTVLPQAGLFPAVSFQLITERNVYSGSGHSGLVGPLFQVDSWAKTALDAVRLGEAVKDALHKLVGVFGLGRTVQGVFCTRRTAFYEPDTKLHRISADFFLWYGD